MALPGDRHPPQITVLIAQTVPNSVMAVQRHGDCA
jgi:hypothetical protein